eukprot:COSAG02_NODE_8871_length_2416_cov_2.074234_4_plen_30_part_01
MHYNLGGPGTLVGEDEEEALLRRDRRETYR